ncbi:MAG: nucleotidyltransferase domain-containing protein [Tannerellaceae bacterium]
MDQKEAIKLVEQYKDVIEDKLPIKAVYLYGSYSKGGYSSDSDIDVAVIVDKLKDDFFEDTPLLWKLRRKISSLIEPVLLVDDMADPLYRDIINTGIRV